jgi:hypothetical protein
MGGLLIGWLAVQAAGALTIGWWLRRAVATEGDRLP